MSNKHRPYRHDVSRLRRTGEAFADLVERIPDSGWQLPTPCEPWPVRQLVAHVASIVADLVALAKGQTRPPAIDPGELHSGAVVANRIRGTLEPGIRAWRQVRLSEIREFPWGATPAVRAVQFTIVELTGHGWDLATALGIDATFRDDDVEASAHIARCHLAVARRADLFDEPRPVPVGASALDSLAALLGRQIPVSAERVRC